MVEVQRYGQTTTEYFGYKVIPITMLQDEVPVEFPNSTITEGDIDHPVTRQKTFEEYVYQYPTMETGALIRFAYSGESPSFCRDDIVELAEFELFADYFGIGEVMTRAEFMDRPVPPPPAPEPVVPPVDPKA